MNRNFKKNVMPRIMIIIFILGCFAFYFSLNYKQIVLKTVLKTSVPNPYNCRYLYEKHHATLIIKNKPIVEVYTTYKNELKKSNWIHLDEEQLGQLHSYEKNIYGKKIRLAIIYFENPDSSELEFSLRKK